jgi:N6-L-threonylcarbamoyladenine synthase
MPLTILAIESSCDDTSAAVVRDGVLLSNLVAGQDVHISYGGVVPELASRAHLSNIVPVVDMALKKASVTPGEIDALAFTRGPGLLGSLLVGTSFAKGFSLAMDIKLIEVNHLHAHVLSHWIREKDEIKQVPELPFLCLLVSGGHTQLVVIDENFRINQIGSTIDDAAGEAFDKCAKVIGLPYPGGPFIDKLSKTGNSSKFVFTRPRIKNLDFSFSGLKTNFLYFVRDSLKENANFIEENRADLAASIQKTIIDILLDKLDKASRKTGIRRIGIAGGVAANSGLRERLREMGQKQNWELFIPHIGYTTDNAAMIAITGYFKYLRGEFSNHEIIPKARYYI